MVEDEKNLNRQLDALQRLVDNTHLVNIFLDKKSIFYSKLMSTKWSTDCNAFVDLSFPEIKKIRTL